MIPILPLSIPEAIAREEGFYVKDTRSNRNNNPGNIEFGSFARRFGATEGDPRFAIFPSTTAGWSALRSLLQEYYKGLTISQALDKWAPSNENNTVAYIRNVCAWTELQPNTIIDDYIQETTNAGNTSQENII